MDIRSTGTPAVWDRGGMEIQELGPLRVRRVARSAETLAKDPPLTLVLLHGFGAPGDDLAGLASSIAVPEGTAMIFPEAPLSLAELFPDELAGMGDARAWWPIDIARFERAIARGELRDLSRDEPPGLAPAREALDAMLDALEREGPSRIVLGGFSQGAMLATDLAMRGTRRLEGLVLLSGTLLAEDAWLPRLSSRVGMPVFQSHGSSDPILPCVTAERLRDAMIAAGLDVTYVPFEGGHGVPPRVTTALGAWLRSRA
jgi:phospholipase/carboxylesterase